jgi:hypothetical protein
MGIEEGEDVQAQEKESIFNKIIREKFPHLERKRPLKKYGRLLGYLIDKTEKNHSKKYS